MDVSLDDLIQKDRMKAKTEHKAHRKNNNFKTKRINHGEQPQKHKFQKNFNSNRFQNRPQDNGPNRRFGNKKFNRFENKRENFKVKVEEVSNKKSEEPKFEKGRTLKILGLHPDITNQDLYKLFAAEGALEKCMIEQDNFGRNLPSALVKYHTAENAKQATQNINGKKILNSVLTVEPYKRSP